MVNQYRIEEELGQGSFGTVFLFIDDKTKLYYAGKECDKKYIKKKLMNGATFGESQIAKEIAVMKKLQH